MKKKPNLRFIDVLHLSDLYCEQYAGRNLCLSQQQNDTCFRDFVGQYYAALYWRNEPFPIINTEIPLF